MSVHIFQPGDKVQTLLWGERTVAWDDGGPFVWLRNELLDGMAHQWHRSELSPVPKVAVMWGNHYDDETYWYDTRTDADRMADGRTYLLKWEQVDGQTPVITVIEDGEP